MYRADDVVAAVRELPGQWLFITLTVDRSQFLGPKFAYEACKDRVRRVAKACGLIWFGVIEPQTRTGDGWIHWHLMVYVPRHISERERKRTAQVVRRRWRHIVTVREEVVDRDTGELILPAVRRREPIGLVDVQIAGSKAIDTGNPEGCGRYVAKYLVKGWEAVPNWMGDEPGKRWRKFRASPEFYGVLERLHRHDRRRGQRKPPRPGTFGRKGASLFQRMALSGSYINAFTFANGRLTFTARVRIPIDDVSKAVPAYPLRLGHWGSVRYKLTSAALSALMQHQDTPEAMSRRRRYVNGRLRTFEAAWDHMQGRADLPTWHHEPSHSFGLVEVAPGHLKRRDLLTEPHA